MTFCTISGVFWKLEISFLGSQGLPDAISEAPPHPCNDGRYARLLGGNPTDEDGLARPECHFLCPLPVAFQLRNSLTPDRCDGTLDQEVLQFACSACVLVGGGGRWICCAGLLGFLIARQFPVKSQLGKAKKKQVSYNNDIWPVCALAVGSAVDGRPNQAA